MLTNAFHPLYKSPIRPDPRPLWGILLAVHAFLPVAELYRRMRDAGHPLAAHPGFERACPSIDLKNHEGMEMLRATAASPPPAALCSTTSNPSSAATSPTAARGLDSTPTESTCPCPATSSRRTLTSNSLDAPASECPA